jgi:serine/threonine-protein kinase
MGGANSPPPTPSASGWLTSSGSIDHGRFAPGAILDSRYRIVGLLGRGGMGEVYRADDLRLGQSVALKFLPPELGSSAARLAQFHNEVRTARQVSHANVCRVYDIGEIPSPVADGDPRSGQATQIYISMEYVDGEDLASLLRRIGRLPEDKAIEIARQVCAGLAAAHERGVIHRDLKPANIMLDGAGRARIMDFSLAAVGEVTDVRSGTPAYMAPEQLAGKEVTARSDIYALGLVLYELFTGRRAYDAKNLGDLIEQHATGSVTAPTDLVKSLDHSIERAILRCLENDPARRPASALAVAASLPGGDPVAAALAAGETPSPEMVAAIGGDAAALSPTAGVLWLTACVALLFAAATLADRASIFGKTPFAKPAAVLIDRAQEIRSSLGYTDPPADQASGFAYNRNFLNWAERQGAGRTGWSILQSGRPAPIRFWYRTSPGALVPIQPHDPITATDPPEAIAGMTQVDVDAVGRLQQFIAVPPQVETPVKPEAPAAPMNWNVLFTAAALDPKAFTEVASSETPPTFADERRSWQGTVPGTTTPLRIDAAAYRGRAVYFHLVGAWTLATRDAHTAASSSQDSAFNVIFVLLLLTAAAVLARANVRSGRADRRGAFRLGAFFFFLMMALWAALDHVSDIGEERNRFFDGIGIALFVGAAMYLVYLALEPYVRRSWPTMLVGWSRVVAGRVRDATVGRDMLVGAAVGVAGATLQFAFDAWPSLHGGIQPMPYLPDFETLSNVRDWSLAALACVNSGLQNALINVLVLALLRHLVLTVAARLGRRGPTTEAVATAIAFAASVMIATFTSNDSWSQAIYETLTATIEILVLLRVGLFAACVMGSVQFFLHRLPMTSDSSRFYAVDGWMSLSLVVVIAAVGFWLARANEPLFGKPVER